LSKSCQKVVKKLLKSCQKVVKSCQKVSKNSETGRRRRRKRRRRRRRRRFVAPRPTFIVGITKIQISNRASKWDIVQVLLAK
jgi:hypothetical protein